MDNEIQLISDGDGLAVIGNPAAVEHFLVSEGLPSKDLGLQRLGSALSTGAGIAQAGSEIAANSGRWVKLTKMKFASQDRRRDGEPRALNHAQRRLSLPAFPAPGLSIAADDLGDAPVGAPWAPTLEDRYDIPP